MKAAPVGFQALAPGQRMSDYARCRNPTCNSTSFDNDARGGDRVCNQCGVVQNVRSIENLEEEHRSFNDDDGKSEAKKRVERVSHDGRLVAKIGGNDAMRRIHAAATAEGEGEKSKKDQEKLDELKSKIARLCGIDTSIDSESKQDAYHLADVLVNSEIAHRERCWDPKCRLAGKIAAPVIVAGGILHEALRERGFGRGFEEIAFLVQKSEDGERSRAANVTPKQIGEATEKVLKMCLYQQTFQGAYYTCCPRIKIVKVSAILRNSGAILRNSGAILAQFWRNSAQFWRNYSDAPSSLVKAHDTENDVFLCEMAGGVLPWRDEAERTPQDATALGDQTSVRGTPRARSRRPSRRSPVSGRSSTSASAVPPQDRHEGRREEARVAARRAQSHRLVQHGPRHRQAVPVRHVDQDGRQQHRPDEGGAPRHRRPREDRRGDDESRDGGDRREVRQERVAATLEHMLRDLLQNNAHSCSTAPSTLQVVQGDGIDAMMPHTVAACAILTSHMEKKGQLTSMGFSYPPWLQSIGTDGRPQFDENSSRRSSRRRRASRRLRRRPAQEASEEHPPSSAPARRHVICIAQCGSLRAGEYLQARRETRHAQRS